MKMWGGRFSRETDPGFLELTSSIGFDVRLYPYDVEVTRAWAGALTGAGIIDPGEKEAIDGALDRVKSDLEQGSFEFQADDEDIHTAVERRLTELVGSAGSKVRTGRSRNDQVATDMRMLVMDEAEKLVARIKDFQAALLEQAQGSLDIAVPGHTHLQRAQPVVLAHVLLAFIYMLERDAKRLKAVRVAADEMPLGSGAISGTPYDIDREVLAEELGFSRVSENSVDAVGDRDFACEMAFAVSLLMVHLSRISEQVILWCSQEFGLAELDDAWATGSSLMPQKKNPDGPELVRGKTGRALGDLVSLMTMLKGLPVSYNRDLQEDKEQLFDSIDTATWALLVTIPTISTMKFNRERAREMLDEGFITSTDLADFLVDKGMGFPEAHRVAGEVVARCCEQDRKLEDLSDEELKSFSELFEEGSTEAISIEASLARRSAIGGTSPSEVRKSLEQARKMISDA